MSVGGVQVPTTAAVPAMVHNQMQYKMARRRLTNASLVLTAGYQDQPRGEPSEVTAGYQDRAEQPATPEVYNLCSADSDDEGIAISRSESICPRAEWNEMLKPREPSEPEQNPHTHTYQSNRSPVLNSLLRMRRLTLLEVCTVMRIPDCCK